MYVGGNNRTTNVVRFCTTRKPEFLLFPTLGNQLGRRTQKKRVRTFLDFPTGGGGGVRREEVVKENLFINKLLSTLLGNR